MAQALALQQRDALGEAERLYVDALALDPDAVDALHMLGAICFRTGRLRKSQHLMREALERTEWRIPMIRDNYALVLSTFTRRSEGIEALRGADPAFRAWIDAESRRFAQAIGVAYTGLPDKGDTSISGSSPVRVLIVDDAVPRPDRDAGSVRLVAMMRILQGLGCALTFTTREVRFAGPEVDALRAIGVEVLCRPDIWSVEQVLAVRGSDLDLILFCHYHVAAEFVAAARRCAPQALLVLETCDLHYVRVRREADLRRIPELRREADATRECELAAIRAVDVSLVVSEVERRIVHEQAPEVDVRVVSQVVTPGPSVPGFAARRDMFFVGGFNHRPNVDAMRWYVEAIWPRVRERLPGARTYIVGADMPAEVRGLAGDGIDAVGHVPDLEPYLQGCRLSIAPLRFGAGVKGKITTALAAGVPVVATSIGVEGMHLEHGRDVLVADFADAFGDAIVRLHGDEALWNQLSRAGRETVVRHFSPEAARRVLGELLALAVARRGSAVSA